MKHITEKQDVGYTEHEKEVPPICLCQFSRDPDLSRCPYRTDPNVVYCGVIARAAGLLKPVFCVVAWRKQNGRIASGLKRISDFPLISDLKRIGNLRSVC